MTRLDVVDSIEAFRDPLPPPSRGSVARWFDSLRNGNDSSVIGLRTWELEDRLIAGTPQNMFKLSGLYDFYTKQLPTGSRDLSPEHALKIYFVSNESLAWVWFCRPCFLSLSCDFSFAPSLLFLNSS